MLGMGWNIYGHDWAADMLQKHIANGKMRHAYLFSGPEGVGRRTMALRFAQAVNCTQPPQAGCACGACLACQQIERMQHADLAVVQAEDGGVLKVEQVRELQHFVSLSPYSGKYRVVLLLNFESANANAQNALLKTLEEPNAKVLMLVTVDDAENLLPTITSRCELIRLRPMRPSELSDHLKKTHAVEPSKADLIAHISGGRVGFARRLIEDEVLLETRKAWMEDVLKLISSGKLARFKYSHQHANSKAIKRPEAKIKLLEGMPYWLSFWRDVLLVSTGSDGLITNIDMKQAIERTASQTHIASVERTIRGLEHAFIRIQSANLQLMLDNILLDWPIVNVLS